MKFVFCFSAFFIGCFATVFMNANTTAPTTVDPTALAEFESVPVWETQEMKVTQHAYGTLKSGEQVSKFLCTNRNGYSLEMIDLGATISSFLVPAGDGTTENLVLGCNNIEGYEACTAFLGSTVGRYANRIANSKFSIDDEEYQLEDNDGHHHLHGGKVGFDKRIWKSEPINRDDEVGVRFSLFSENGDEGYPGNLEVTVEYTLNNANELRIDYEGNCDQTCHVNLTNHAYWNLSGRGGSNVLNHKLCLPSNRYVAVDDESIPMGIEDVEGTPFDFRAATEIGSRMSDIKNDPNGYDHCYVLLTDSKASSNAGTKLVATVVDPESGRKMEVLTDQPGIQVYTGNYLDGQPSSGGFDQHQGICLETGALPNSPNRDDFPSTLVRPGETYHHTTIYRFHTGQ